MRKNTLSDHDSIHGHRNLNDTERSAIARHRNFNAPKIYKITVVEIKLPSATLKKVKKKKNWNSVATPKWILVKEVLATAWVPHRTQVLIATGSTTDAWVRADQRWLSILTNTYMSALTFFWGGGGGGWVASFLCTFWSLQFLSGKSSVPRRRWETKKKGKWGLSECQSSHEIATGSVILWIDLGGTDQNGFHWILDTMTQCDKCEDAFFLRKRKVERRRKGKGRVRFPAGAFPIFSVSAKASLPISLSPFPPLPFPSPFDLSFALMTQCAQTLSLQQYVTTVSEWDSQYTHSTIERK